MGRPRSSTFEYVKRELARYGLGLERIRVGRRSVFVVHTSIPIFVANNYRELRAFLLGLEWAQKGGSV